MIHHPVEAQKTPSKTGRYERYLLCSTCDGKLGRYEQSAHKLLRQLRQRRLGKKSGSTWKLRNRTMPFKVPPNDNLVRFACGILWKYASTEIGGLAQISLGDHLRDVEDLCFHGAPVPPHIDVFLERDLFQIVAFDDPTDVYYYQTPSSGMRGNSRQARMVWFNVGGFIVNVRLDVAETDIAPRRCWVAGRSTAYFLASPRSVQEGYNMVGSMQAVQDDLARLNRRIDVSQRGRR